MGYISIGGFATDSIDNPLVKNSEASSDCDSYRLKEAISFLHFR